MGLKVFPQTELRSAPMGKAGMHSVPAPAWRPHAARPRPYPPFFLLSSCFSVALASGSPGDRCLGGA